MEYSKEDLMEAKKQIWGVGENMGTEESKKIWEENAQFWDNAILIKAFLSLSMYACRSISGMSGYLFLIKSIYIITPLNLPKTIGLFLLYKEKKTLSSTINVETF